MSIAPVQAASAAPLAYLGGALVSFLGPEPVSGVKKQNHLDIAHAVLHGSGAPCRCRESHDEEHLGEGSQSQINPWART